MANPEHLAILKKGVKAWTKWRKEKPGIKPDLKGAELKGVELLKANLSRSDLSEAFVYRANFNGSNFTKATFRNAAARGIEISGADLSGANCSGSDFGDADFSLSTLHRSNLSRCFLRHAKFLNANLKDSDFHEADLTFTTFSGSDLSGVNFQNANLEGAQLIGSQLNRSVLTNCRVFGVSAWDLDLEEAIQKNLHIIWAGEHNITVDDLEIAQFIHLLLNNQNIRNIIDRITSKIVLILGRFTEERKTVLDAIRDALRKRNYTPVLFDFDKPASRDLTETISTLAHMARFIIADITEPRCIPQELATIVPTLSVPVKPLLLKGATGEYAMFRDLRKYPWVMSIYRYKNSDELMQSLETKVIAPAEKKAKALIKSKNR